MAAHVAYRAVQRDPGPLPQLGRGLVPVLDRREGRLDRILLAIVASAVLLLFVAASLYVTNTGDVMNHARTVGAAGSK